MQATGRIAPGNIVEISLADGFGYAEVSHLHESYPEVLAVCARRFAQSQADPRKLEYNHVCLFPIASAMASGKLQARIVAPQDQLFTSGAPAARFPVFKFAVRDEQGNAIYWWLWDGVQIELAADAVDITDLPERKVLTLDEFRSLFG